MGNCSLESDQEESIAKIGRARANSAPDLTSRSTDNVDQQKEIVDKHNALRRGVMPNATNMLRMEWSPEAAQNAKNWANECTLSHSPPERRKTRDCGENLYMSSAPSSWSDAIQSWYNEVEDFKYGIGATRPMAVTGHYTQVVWYKSYQIGCAIAFCPDREYSYFYVCHYCPPYNDPGICQLHCRVHYNLSVFTIRRKVQ
uniref:SCP domain-containing protein n=1 Tax=Pelusios castaneus TaxID=367368 RepID=A0A8C8RZ50_9SAUR